MLYQQRNRASTARKRNSVVALIQRLQLQDQALLDVTAFVPKPHLVVAMTMSLQPMVPTRKVVASTLNLAVAQTISVSQLDRNLRAATAKSHNSDAALIISLRPVVRNWKDVDVFTPNTPAVLIATLQLLDPTIKDADATRSNSAAALILSLWLKDPILRAADAKTLLMDAVKMNGHPPMDRNSKAALVNLLNTVAAMTELLPHRVPTMKDAHRNLNFLAKFAHWIRIAVLAVISLSDGSSIWNMAVALVSGTADVMAMTIASQRKMTAKPTVSNQLALRLAPCHELPDPVRVTIHPGTMTLLPAPVNSSAMVAAWVTPIVSPLAKNVISSVLHLNCSTNVRSLRMLEVVKVPSNVGATIRLQ